MQEVFQIALIRAGLSQIELSARLGIHPSTISRIVGGWLVPPVNIQEAILDELEPFGKRIRFGYRLPNVAGRRGAHRSKTRRQR